MEFFAQNETDYLTNVDIDIIISPSRGLGFIKSVLAVFEDIDDIDDNGNFVYIDAYQDF